jgi:PEGA domain
VVSHISEGYAQLFSYRGSRTDKHVREHEIYEVGARLPDHIASKAMASSRNTERPEAESLESEPAATVQRPGAELKHPWWSNARAAYVAALASVLVLAAAVVVSERRPETVVVAPAKTIVASSATTTQRSAEKQVVRKMVELDDLLELPSDPAPEPKEQTLSRKRTTPVVSTDIAGVAGRPEPEAAPRDPSPRVPAAASAQGDAAIAEKAVIAFAVSPWGEVFVNGAKLGVSPPVNVVEVSAGKAAVEIRNPGFPSYTETIELAPGQRIRVKHKF